MSEPALVLASASLARARLLTDAGLVFSVQAARVDEAALKTRLVGSGLDLRTLALELAVAKACDVAHGQEALVIGGDQTLELDGVLFDKPPTLGVARDQLKALRGRPHQLHAAAAVVRGETVLWRTLESVTLHMRAFSDAFLEAYLAKEGDALLGCVGAYRLEALGVQLFDRIEGDYFTVLGLPLLPLIGFLRAEGRLAA